MAYAYKLYFSLYVKFGVVAHQHYELEMIKLFVEFKYLLNFIALYSTSTEFKPKNMKIYIFSALHPNFRNNSSQGLCLNLGNISYRVLLCKVACSKDS